MPLHYVWEFLQVPTYADMAEIAHWQGIKHCTSAAVGDVGFGTGLGPFLRWIVIPPIVVWPSRRHLAGSVARQNCA